ncbi:MAG: alpha/beta hydrolase [Tissierellia bacterium]|nr:alpha/beta hydrolase [Tissierellia bacterium]
MEPLNSFDGTKLNIKVEEVKDERGVVIIVHGLGEHLGRYDHVALRLQQKGYTTYRYDQRGHGHSEGKRAYLKDYYELPLDLYEMVKKVQEEKPGKPLFILGQSMGGLTALLFASMYPEMDVNYIVSGAPSPEMIVYEDLEGRPQDEYIEDDNLEGICSDPEVVKGWEEDPLTQNAYSVGLFQSLSKGKDYLKTHLSQVKCPIIFLHGAMDQVVTPDNAWTNFSLVSSEDKALHIYEKQYHEVYHDYMKEQVIDDVIHWIKRRQ